MAQYMSDGPYQPDPYLRLVPDQGSGRAQDDDSFREPPTAPQPVLSRVPLPPLPPFPPQGPALPPAPVPPMTPLPPRGTGRPPSATGLGAPWHDTAGDDRTRDGAYGATWQRGTAADEVSHGDLWDASLAGSGPRRSAPPLTSASQEDIPWGAGSPGDAPRWRDFPSVGAPGQDADWAGYGLWDPAEGSTGDDRAQLAQVRKTGRKYRLMQFASLIAAFAMAGLLAFSVMRHHADQRTLMVAPVIIVASVFNYFRAGKVIATARAVEQRLLAG